MSRRLPILIGLAALAVALMGAIAFVQLRQAPVATVAAVDIGGSFQLLDTQGRAVTEKALLGKPSVVFFGFTYCPEVCPTTLTELSAAMKALGRDADKLNVVIVSVDPERDTPEQMKLYLSSFDPRIQGFTGTPEAIAQAAKAYRVFYKKVPLEGGRYTVDHSSAIYLFDRKGRFVEPIGYGTPHERVVAQLKKLATQG
ncbi:SCO family protein [Phenylobacterium sp. Root700]|uniref:SCO family protein n=1 Tax=Phenylobacterium sp. Root700 TaxID=1736591 RepID=UPI0006FC67BB|nr:SCO family protein [Phenylobacterium sp. Root700]KRB44443.1 photosynthetic protein synthase I [Phenylobacterium sp. Root700]